MTDLAIESIGNGEYDLVITDNDLVMLGVTEATWPALVAQRLAFELGTWHGESAFDRSVGFPWLEGVFGRQPLDGIAALVYEHIVETEGVEGVIGQPVLLLDTRARVLTISADVRGRGFEIPVSFTVAGGS